MLFYKTRTFLAQDFITSRESWFQNLCFPYMPIKRTDIFIHTTDISLGISPLKNQRQKQTYVRCLRRNEAFFCGQNFQTRDVTNSERLLVKKSD